MPGSAHDLTHLAALIEAARAEAGRIDGPAREAERHLAAAAAAVRSSGGGGRPDEGVRLQDLTTENDE